MAGKLHTYKNSETKKPITSVLQAQAQGIFKPRPFGLESEQIAPPQQPLDLKAELMRAQRYGHNLSHIQLSNPAPIISVQPKKRLGQPLPSQPQTKAPRQARFAIGQPGDRYEQEADRVASQVVQQINAPTPQQSTQSQPVQRDVKPDEEELMKTNQPTATSLGSENVIQRMKRSASLIESKDKEIKRPRLGKQRQLEELGRGESNSNKTPMKILKENQHLLVNKADPLRAGDHSPSLANYNKATDNRVAVSGRPHFKYKQNEKVDLSIKEDVIPTLQYRRPSGKEIVPGAEGHSITTSLRAIAGVGEHAKLPLDETLDRTLTAYQGPVTLLSSGNKLKVDLFKKGANESLLRHPVDPLIAQAVSNIWLRGSVESGKPLRGVI